MGGLGNQMFQIAHAISQGRINETPVLFTKDTYTPMQAKKTTNYMDNIFRKLRFVDYLPESKIVTEKSWNNSDVKIIDNTSLQFYGYFQSSKNFFGMESYIKDVFEPSESFLNKIKSLYPILFSNECTSIHIRRGDYLSISDILPTLDISYYQNCLSKIKNINHVFIFSDDKKWCHENLQFFAKYNCTIVENLEDYEELWMMSLCTNNIISNSTFSWWGTFLNKKERKQTFAPNVWFGPRGEKKYDSIYEPDWNLINVNYVNGVLIP